MAEEGKNAQEEPAAEAAEKAPETPPPAEPETVQEYETKERHRSTTSNVTYDTSSHAIPPQTKQQLRT